MIDRNPDRYVAEALAFAAENRPCIIGCRTIKAMDEVGAALAQISTVRTARGSDGSRAVLAAVNAFDSGETEFLVMPTMVLQSLGFRFTRLHSVACTHRLTAHSAQRVGLYGMTIRSRIASTYLNVHAQKLCSPPL